MQNELLALADDSKSAVISDCGLYRYQLRRRWGGGPSLPFIMLNPSTADANNDDPTIRRCIGFAKSRNFGGILVVNLFAFRATSPVDMKRATDPVGRDNNIYLLGAMANADIDDVPVIAAWGTHGNHRNRANEVMALADRPLWCLGTTKDGHPKHPLYVPADAPWVPMTPPRAIAEGTKHD